VIEDTTFCQIPDDSFGRPAMGHVGLHLLAFQSPDVVHLLPHTLERPSDEDATGDEGS
jgi:hypothetical protein